MDVHISPEFNLPFPTSPPSPDGLKGLKLSPGHKMELFRSSAKNCILPRVSNYAIPGDSLPDATSFFRIHEVWPIAPQRSGSSSQGSSELGWYPDCYRGHGNCRINISKNKLEGGSRGLPLPLSHGPVSLPVACCFWPCIQFLVCTPALYRVSTTLGQSGRTSHGHHCIEPLHSCSGFLLALKDLLPDVLTKSEHAIFLDHCYRRVALASITDLARQGIA